MNTPNWAGRYLFGLRLVFSTVVGFSQPVVTRDSQVTATYNVEDIIQAYMESRQNDGDLDYNTLTDKLEYLQQHPISINELNEIDELILLTPSQILAIKSYIQQHGNLISVYELQAIPGLDVETIRWISPFIKLDANFDQYQVSLKDMIQYGHHQLFFRTGRFIQKSKAYDPGQSGTYKGSPWRWYMRYKLSYENKMSIGFTGEKDPGEEFFKGSNRHGFDFNSYHLAWRNIHPVFKEVVLGDYNVSMGQGLIIHSGFGVSKSPMSTSIRKGGRMLSPYTSVNESNFLRGAAVQIQLNRHWASTVFLSYRKKDGNILDTDSLNRDELFSSFQESGYHRNNSEIADENKITEYLAGGTMRYTNQFGHVAFNAMYTDLDKSLIRRSLPYNLYAFKGNQLTQMSMDHGLQLRNFNFFGELALSNPGTWGILEGVQINLDKKLDLAILYRLLDKSYPALYSNAFTENTLASNERGFYLGVEARPAARWKITAYWDQWSHDWLRFNTQAPSRGQERLVRMTYSIRRKMEAYIQYRQKSTIENTSGTVPLKMLAEVDKMNVRAQLNYQWNKAWESRTRLETVSYSKETFLNQTGFLFFQDVLYHPIQIPVNASARLAYYSTEGYDSGIYAYENDLLYNFYVPNYNGKGWRYYVNLRYEGIRQLSLEARYAVTNLTSGNTLGSGLDQISGNRRSELKFQIRWMF